VKVGPGAIALGTLAAAIAGAAIVGVQGGPATGTHPGPATATVLMGLCHVSVGGGSTATALRVVERARSDDVTVYAVDGARTVLCDGHRDARGVFRVASSGYGRVEPADPGALTYDTAIGAGSPPQPAVVAGRVTADATRVVVVADGGQADASVANGLFVARLESAGRVTSIVALDASGHAIARLADESGLRPPVASR